MYIKKTNHFGLTKKKDSKDYLIISIYLWFNDILEIMYVLDMVCNLKEDGAGS